MDSRVLQQADQAITKLNRSLSMFEKDLQKYHSEGDKIIADVEERLKQIICSYDAQLNVLTQKNKEQVAEWVFVVSKQLEEQRQKLDAFIDTRTREFTDHAFEMFKSGLEEKRVQSVAESDKAFETDVEGLFKKYENRLAPILFKMLMRHVFRFGRKSCQK